MKAYLRELCANAPTRALAVHNTREYLQARILKSLQRAGAMTTLAFHGGTALRFLYSIPRYSEDLDLALEQTPQTYDLHAYLRRIKRDFAAEAYTVEFKVRDKRTVQHALVRFRGLLHELGLSPHEAEVLAVKLEVDTNPPQGAGLVTTSVRRHVRLNLLHHDPASLLAGKLHAILQRSYTKGRDIFDLWWYLSQPEWPEPNLVLLNNALVQSEWPGPPLDADNWRVFVRERIERLEWQETVVRDIEAFVVTDHRDEAPSHPALLHLLDRPD